MFHIKLKNGDKLPYTVAKAQEIIAFCKGKVLYRYGYAYVVQERVKLLNKKQSLKQKIHGRTCL